MSTFQMKPTKHGYNFFEVASAFQKSIRRCDEKQAMFWAVELYESGYQRYAWKRMLIMSCEDCGLGEPTTNTIIFNLKQTYDYLVSLKERSLPEKLPFTQAVLQLVHSRKSRFVDLAISVYWQENATKHYDMPDYVFDMHTLRGKQMGRGLDHFYAEAAKINNANKMPNEEAFEQIAMEADKAAMHPQYKENISCTKKESDSLAQGNLFEQQ